MIKRHKNWDGRGRKRATGLRTWRNTVKPFLVMCSYFALQQWSGINAVTFYSILLLGDAVSGKGILATCVVDIVSVLASIVTSQIMWQFGRRSLTAVSGIGAGTMLIVLGGLLMFNITSPLLLISILSMYVIFICLGFRTIPWIMIGEVFPFTKRGTASGITAAFCHIVAFSVLKSLPSLLSSVGAQGVFLLYGLVAFFGTMLVLIWLPETQNRTLDEIEYSLTQTNEQTENES